MQKITFIRNRECKDNQLISKLRASHSLMHQIVESHIHLYESEENLDGSLGELEKLERERQKFLGSTKLRIRYLLNELKQ